MEMVEEGIDQPKITRKRIKVEEIVEEEKEDRISALPDGLLLEILSRLPSTESAIRTGTLSKRWKYLWTTVPTLIFRREEPPDQVNSDFVSFVDKTLTQCRQSKLRRFEVDTIYDIQIESQVNNWIRYAISCNVEELDLTLLDSDLVAAYLLNEYVFINSCFTDLRLQGCIFNPTGAISWKGLRSLVIISGSLDEDLIENILSGTPLLETLVLDRCYGFRRVDITSKSVKKLVFFGYFDPFDYDLADIIEINAPNILSLTIKGELMLWKLLLLNVSSLVEAYLDFTKEGYRDETTPKEAEEEMLKGFIRSLRHVKELKIGARFSKEAYEQTMLEKYDSDFFLHQSEQIVKLQEALQAERQAREVEREAYHARTAELEQMMVELAARDAERQQEVQSLQASVQMLLSRLPPPPPGPSPPPPYSSSRR